MRKNERMKKKESINNIKYLLFFIYVFSKILCIKDHYIPVKTFCHTSIPYVKSENTLISVYSLKEHTPASRSCVLFKEYTLIRAFSYT